MNRFAQPPALTTTPQHRMAQEFFGYNNLREFYVNNGLSKTMGVLLQHFACKALSAFDPPACPWPSPKPEPIYDLLPSPVAPAPSVPHIHLPTPP